MAVRPCRIALLALFALAVLVAVTNALTVAECQAQFICRSGDDMIVLTESGTEKCQCEQTNAAGDKIRYDPEYLCGADATPGCYSCDSAGACVSCNSATQLVDGKCMQCNVENCALCYPGNGNQCQICSAIWLNESTCQTKDPFVQGDCGVAHCANCRNDTATTCFTCNQWFTLNETGACNSQCNVPNCQICSPGDVTRCMLCYYGFAPNADGTTCTSTPNACRVAHCEQCDASLSKCATCADGFNQTADGLCSNCQVPHCIKCDPSNITSCLECATYYKPVGGACVVPACEVPGCEFCNINNANVCVKCEASYNLVSGRCAVRTSSLAPTLAPTTTQSCNIANCAACVANNPNKCSKCKTGYTVNVAGTCGVTGACRVYYCNRCRDGDDVHCRQCRSGYGLTTSSLCVKMRSSYTKTTVRRSGVSDAPRSLLAALVLAVAAVLMAL